MNGKEIFKQAYEKNELAEFFKGSKGYMLYPEDAYRFIDPKAPGTGNLMNHAFVECVIPFSEENPQLEVGNKVVDVLNQMILSNKIDDFYSGVRATTAIVDNDYEEKLKISKDKFEKLLNNMKVYIQKNKKFLENTLNYYGAISFYEEFTRMNDNLDERKRFL